MSMNRIQYLLIKGAEESSEVSQMAIKTAQFGLHEVYSPNPDQPAFSNIERLRGELIDLLAVVELLNEEAELGLKFTVTDSAQKLAILAKKQKIAKYYKYSVEQGLTENPIIANDHANILNKVTT